MRPYPLSLEVQPTLANVVSSQRQCQEGSPSGRRICFFAPHFKVTTWDFFKTISSSARVFESCKSRLCQGAFPRLPGGANADGRLVLGLLRVSITRMDVWATMSNLWICTSLMCMACLCITLQAFTFR